MAVAYVPYGTDKVTQTSNISKPDIPNYPDKGGIYFAGYYKVQLAGGGYQVLTQERFQRDVLITGGTPYSETIADGKTLYVQDIAFECFGTVGGSVSVWIGDDTNFKVGMNFPTVAAGSHNEQFHFTVPLEFKGTIYYDGDVGTSALVRLSGWIE